MRRGITTERAAHHADIVPIQQITKVLNPLTVLGSCHRTTRFIGDDNDGAEIRVQRWAQLQHGLQRRILLIAFLRPHHVCNVVTVRGNKSASIHQGASGIVENVESLLVGFVRVLQDRGDEQLQVVVCNIPTIFLGIYVIDVIHHKIAFVQRNLLGVVLTYLCANFSSHLQKCLLQLNQLRSLPTTRVTSYCGTCEYGKAERKE
mmetsp:Transcript_35921/g.61856  ORF Transcript_35921/g.61856 Transcript_35921/m.61856 type:complete len:204 (-) Transcript_35921:16-627(-)